MGTPTVRRRRYSDDGNSRVIFFCERRREIVGIVDSRLHEREEDLQGASEKAGKLLFEAHVRLSVAAPQAAAQDAKEKILEIAGTFGQFSSHRLASFHLSRLRRKPARWLHAPAFLLSTEELATLWHPATSTVRATTQHHASLSNDCFSTA